jgi:hypothetical protein
MAEEASVLEEMDNLDTDSMAIEAELEALGGNPEELLDAVDQDLIIKELADDAAAEAIADAAPTNL